MIMISGAATIDRAGGVTSRYDMQTGSLGSRLGSGKQREGSAQCGFASGGDCTQSGAKPENSGLQQRTTVRVCTQSRLTVTQRMR